MKVPAVSLISNLDANASAFDLLHCFCASHACQVFLVLSDFSPGQHGEILLRQHKVLRLLDSQRPRSEESFPLLTQPPLAAWAPFQVAVVSDCFLLSAALAFAHQVLLAASREVAKL